MTTGLRFLNKMNYIEKKILAYICFLILIFFICILYYNMMLIFFFGKLRYIKSVKNISNHNNVVKIFDKTKDNCLCEINCGFVVYILYIHTYVNIFYSIITFIIIV